MHANSSALVQIVPQGSINLCIHCSVEALFYQSFTALSLNGTVVGMKSIMAREGEAEAYENFAHAHMWGWLNVRNFCVRMFLALQHLQARFLLGILFGVSLADQYQPCPLL